MNSSEDPETRLDELLRQSPPPLRGQEFSRRVLAALPAPAARDRILPRLLVCSAGAMVGLIVLLVRIPSWSDVTSSFDQMNFSLAPLAGAFSDPMIMVVVVVTALSLLYAFGFRQRRYFRL